MTLSLPSFSSLTPAEEGAGAGAALGLMAGLLFFKRPSLPEAATMTLVGGVVGYLGAQAWAAGMGAPAAANTLPPAPASPAPAPTPVPGDQSQTSADAGGGGSSF